MQSEESPKFGREAEFHHQSSTPWQTFLQENVRHDHQDETTLACKYYPKGKKGSGDVEKVHHGLWGLDPHHNSHHPTDTATTVHLGWGAWWGMAWAYDSWDPQYMQCNSPSIDFLELYAVVVGTTGLDCTICQQMRSSTQWQPAHGGSI